MKYRASVQQHRMTYTSLKCCLRANRANLRPLLRLLSLKHGFFMELHIMYIELYIAYNSVMYVNLPCRRNTKLPMLNKDGGFRYAILTFQGLTSHQKQ